MEQLLEDSLDALRTNWEGASAPAIKASQFWSDLSDTKLKIMAQGSSTEWRDLYDFTAEEIVISADQVGTTEISSAARKGTIVTGENIDPNTCTLQAKFKNVSLFSTPCELFPLFASPSASGLGAIDNPSGAWYDLMTSKIYVPDDAGTLYMMFRQLDCNVRFNVGGTLSTETGAVAGPAWGTEAFADLASLSGWYAIEVQGWSSVSFPGPNYGGISGVASRWET
jgi:hypothetical protein